jgi:protein transport protein SEC24
MAIICQPFAELTPLEEPVPLIDYGEAGPLRCTRCRAYVNPHFGWASGGKEAVCNFCGQRMDVAPEYFCALDEKNRRRDEVDRPELVRGTVDYLAPRDYSDVLPGLPGLVFVIEASQLSVQSGFFHQVLWTIRSLVAFLPSHSRVGIITFDQTLHFYSFSPYVDEARQIIMADLEDPFVPCGADCLCVDVQDEAYSAQFEALLERLPDLFAGACSDQVVGCSALRAAVEMMSSRGGGDVLMFHALLPNTGVGALRSRDDIRLYGTPEGAALYLPQQPALFDAIAGDCLAKGVAVTTWLAPAMGVYGDAASLSVVPRRTGGEFFFLSAFTPARDAEKLHYQISRTVVQAGTAYSCIFKLRCGKGLTVDSMYANWDPEVIDPSTFQVSRLSPDGTAVFVLTHTERIEGQKHAYFQAACLYTDRSARRLIRVHTLQLPVTSSLSNVFRYTEIDTVTNMLIKQAACCAIKGDMSFKERLTKSCVDMLHAYRINCASTTAAGQLILPESLKLLPLYIGALRKMPAFRSGSDVRMDERVAGLVKVLSLPISQSVLLIYPRVYPLIPMNERMGRSTGVGENVYLPATVACSYERLAKDSICLFDNGVTLHLYVVGEATQETLFRVFGVNNFNEVPAAFAQSLSPGVSVSEDLGRILAIIQQIRKDRSRLPWMPLSLVLPGTAEEGKLHALFAEDRIAGEMQYVDFLCHIHKLVQNKASY